MVKPEFDIPGIDVWVHDGKLGRTQPSLCLFHPRADVGSLLLDVLRDLQSAGRPAARTFAFALNARKKAIARLTFSLLPESDQLKVMHIRCDRAEATIQFTPRGIPLLINAFTSWLRGNEDFGVSPRHASLKPKDLGPLDSGSGELWFWGPQYHAP